VLSERGPARRCRARRGVVSAVVGLCALALSGPAAGDACFQDGWDNGSISTAILFPNWYRVTVASADFWLWDAVAGAENVRGITVCNFGTAGSGDFAGVYVQMYCGATNSGLLTLTYAGLYSEDSGSLPAWTWAGSTVDFQGCADLCGNPACGGFFTADIIVDVAPCPTAGASVRMGFPTKNFLGSVTDSMGCQAPSGDAGGPVDTIQYLYKLGPDAAAPGDTVQFTVYYGKPGNSAISAIRIIDSVPDYTHYVDGAGTPAPDPGWEPDPGPPPRLLWSLPGAAPAGGATAMITFSLSVDWGNGESFEPGSGDVAAPEATRLANRAHGTWVGASCPNAVSNQVQTSVKRILMWLVGDNDVLFSPTYGQPPDEIIYSIFMKNVSTEKTWWDVRVWDTVPANLDVWCQDCGFEDPCTGWTMTPSGCAAAGPGRTLPAGNTMLTWKLDMPPQFTIAMRWKARVRSNALAGSTAVNVMSLLEVGRTNVAEGTGHSTVPMKFAHLAPVILPTTYVSYVAYSGDRWAQPDPGGDALTMFPLNKKTQFELRSLDYVAGWANASGVSASIGCLIGDCLGGFPGSAGPCPTGAIGADPSTTAGCKAERVPARYNHPVPAGTPYQHLYKITSNSPVNWQSEPGVGSQCGDFMTYAPATTLNFTGLLHYYWKNSYHPTYNNSGTEMFFINTGKDPYGNYDSTMPTSVHIFRFSYTTLLWDYQKTYDLAGESGACDQHTLTGEEGPYRSISSQGQLIVWQGYQSLSTLGCGCPCYDNSVLMPTRDTGNVVGLAGHTFYGVMQGYGNETKVSLGNVGVADATYRVYLYLPDYTAGPAEVPINMRGTSGTWLFQGMAIVPQGLAAALNPRIYNVDGTLFDGASTSAFKVEVVSGGPIQIFHGARVFAGWGGGAVLNAVNGKQTGSEFWLHTIYTDGTVGASPETYAVDVFCPKTGMVVECRSETGLSGTYTTTGPDQCISFVGFNNPGRKMNYKFTRLNTGATGDVIAQYINAGPEKGYTAPFLQTGVHYAIILPEVVYAGQSFWMTIIVLDQGGDTKTDYCGTSSFTSTDPAAKIETQPMAGYDYTWKASVGCSGAPNNNGVRIFMNMMLSDLGLQSVIVIDTTDGSISGVGATMVVGADIKLSKEPKLTVAASGDTVRFKICWSNYSSGSGFAMVMTDAVPVGTSFIPEASAAGLDCGSTDGVALAVSYSTLATPTMPGAASFSGGNPVAGTRWLRWTVPVAGVQTSGCACFRVKVD